MDTDTQNKIKQARRLLAELDLLRLSQLEEADPRKRAGHLMSLARCREVNGLPIYALPPLKSYFVPRSCLPILDRYFDGDRGDFEVPLKIRRRIEALATVLLDLELVASKDLIEEIGVRPKWFWEFVQANPDWFVVFSPSKTTWMPRAWVPDLVAYVENWRQDLEQRKERRRAVVARPRKPRVIPSTAVVTAQNPLVDVDVERLRQIREELHLRQEEVSDQLGVSRATYVSVETGVRKLRLAEVKLIDALFRKHWNQSVMGPYPRLA